MAGATTTTGTRAESGMTLVEVMITLTVLAILMGVIARSQLTVSQANSTMAAANKVSLQTQEAVSHVHADISMARKMYEDDVLGRSYLARIQVVNISGLGVLAIAPTSRLPTIEPLGEFNADAVASPRTGNCIFMAEEMAPHDTLASDGKTYRINIFRLVGYFVMRHGTPAALNLSRFDLVRWESEAFADYTTLTAIGSVAARQEVVADLLATAKIDYAWDPIKNADQAFYVLSTDVSPTPDGTITIPASQHSSAREDRRPKVYFRPYVAALASNNTLIGENAIPKFAVKIDATVDPAGVGFPHGFEVKIIGPSGARKVLVRLVAEISRGGQIVRSVSETKGTMRDL